MLIYLQTLEAPDEKEKFETLYRTYCGLMVAVAMKLLGNRTDAEDAVHQAFLSILKNMDGIPSHIQNAVPLTIRVKMNCFI